MPFGGSADQKRHIGGRSFSPSIGTPERVDADVPRIHPLEQEVDDVAAPAAVFAAKDDDDRELGLRQDAELGLEQLVAQHG